MLLPCKRPAAQHRSQTRQQFRVHLLRPVLCRSVAHDQQHQHQHHHHQQQPTTGQQDHEAAAAAASIRQLLTRRSYAPSRYVGPVEVTHIPGKRFGLTATRNLSVGDLLLVSTPLAAAFGPAGHAPSNDSLLQHMEIQVVEPWQQQWLRALCRSSTAAAAAAAAAAVTAPAGTAADAGRVCGDAAVVTAAADGSNHDTAAAGASHESAAAAAAVAAAECDPAALLAVLQALLHKGLSNTHNTSSNYSHTAAAAAAAGVGEDSGAGDGDGSKDLDGVSTAGQVVTGSLSEEQLQQVVAENAYSEAAEDLGAALLRELDPEGLTGLWPEYALLNHSCAPNTLAVCVGRYLLLHATRPVLRGEELLCSYLGEAVFRPVSVRRAQLQGVYGFHCTCTRCLEEQRTFPTQYYPADNHLLGLGSSTGSSSGSSSRGVLQAVMSGARRLGFWRDRSEPPEGLADSPVPPNPSPEHKLLQQQYESVLQELRPAVRAAAAADSRRAEQQLQLLQEVTELMDSVRQEVAAAVAADGVLRHQQQPDTSRLLLAAAYPLMQLQLDLLDMLLADEGIPLDDTQLLLDDTYGSGSGGLGSGGRGSAPREAAVAAKLSLSSRRRRQQQWRTLLPTWLSGLVPPAGGTSSDLIADSAGRITKRQLLEVQARVLGQAVGVLDAVARGSEAHVVQSIRHVDVVRRLRGHDSQEAAEAEGLCSRAHTARYGIQRGAEGTTLMARLVSARRRQMLGVSLARKMSFLAWENATKPL